MKLGSYLRSHRDGGARFPAAVKVVKLSDRSYSIDTVITGAYPRVSLVFDVAKQSTGQNIYSLTKNNVFFYENGKRIDEFSFGKDTTCGVGAVAIVFVLDVTGSMSGSIAGVKNTILEFADSLSSRGVHFRLGMVTFLDAASQMAFRPTAKRVFVWITDATYHEKNTFTQATDGTFYSIGGNFRDILLDIGNLKGSNRYLLSNATQQPKTASKELRLTIHYAGLGGTAATVFARRRPDLQHARTACALVRSCGCRRQHRHRVGSEGRGGARCRKNPFSEITLIL